MRVVLASYDGVLAGPGRSQTVPYARGLTERGHEVLLLSYERPEHLADDARVRAVEEALGGAPWTRIPWRRRASADLANGVAALRRAVREHRVTGVHARGYVPALIARMLGMPFVFDMRGFWPDERVDGGLWRRGSAGHRTWKRIERSLCARAASIVVLTERAKQILHERGLVDASRPVYVIPTCTDLERFRPIPEPDRAPDVRGDGPRYVILGGTGTWYLLDAMLDLGARALARDAAARLHVLTQDDPGPVRDGLARRGIDSARALVTTVPYEDVPGWISGARAGIALLRPAESKAASCPTKLGEFLACGVPVVMSPGVGDVDTLLDEHRIGVVTGGFDAAALDAALDTLDRLHEAGTDLARRCREVAVSRFALDVALDSYERAYRESFAPVGAA